MIMQEHYSLRLKNNKQGMGLLSPVLTDPMTDLLDDSFNTYQDYKLIYEEYFLPIFSPDVPVPAESSAYLGAMTFRKNVNNEISLYTMERLMEADENKGAVAKTTSLTRYSHIASNDLYCKIPQDCLMSQHYKVTRNRYNQELADIYEYSQQNSLESLGVDITGNKVLLTNLSIVDAVQKLSCLDKRHRILLHFDYLENMESVKPRHTLAYVDSIQASFGGKRLVLNGFCQTGSGMLPTFYWATESGMLIYIRNGIHFLVLTGREG